jgi:putative transposase
MKRSATRRQESLRKSGSGSRPRRRWRPIAPGAKSKVIQGALLEFVVGVGMASLEAMLERDRDALCGWRYKHCEERHAYRAGYVAGQLVLGGRRVHVARPRVRSVDGQEIRLPTWETYSCTDPLSQRAYEQLIVGASTRKYERSLEPVVQAVQTSGTSKSAVSRRFIECTQDRLKQLMHRPLHPLKILVLMLDGIRLGEHMLLVALGVDESGKKHVLGLVEGATENSAACTRLLTDLRERGLGLENRAILVVIDGAKALRKSVKDVFGRLALVQRCQEHKKRNGLDHLPETMKDAIRARLAAIYASRRVLWAEKELRSLAEELTRTYPGAAASLLEGLEETLTLMRLHVNGELGRSLSTTNLVENLMGAIRRITRNVDHWQGGQMALRWTAAALLEAEPRFARLPSARHLGLLKLSLQAHYASLTSRLVDPTEQAA